MVQFFETSKYRMKVDIVLLTLVIVIFLFSLPKLITTYRVMSGQKCKEWATRYSIYGLRRSSFDCKEWE
jgi:hypothetical protein